MEAALLAPTAMNQQKHLILEMMKMENCNGARVGALRKVLTGLSMYLRERKNFLRNKRIHAMLVGDTAAVTVEYLLSAGMKQPVMIITE